jgi:hypothetical protein
VRLTEALAVSLAGLVTIALILVLFGRDGLFAALLTTLFWQIAYRARHGRWFDYD